MLHIRPFYIQDLEAIQSFTDREIGQGYYSLTELHDIFARSSKEGVMCSLLIEDSQNKTIKAVRISYPPGQWQKGKGQGLNPHSWPHQQAATAYFQSLFLSRDLQGQGWGVRISHASIKALRQEGTQGIVCHSWKESPHDSSSKYLRKLGFKLIAEHPKYWQEVQYNCTRCGTPPCQCTAQEMYLDLVRNL